MKKILCPTDLSPTANNAVEFAATLAKKTGASLLLLHVLSDHVYTSEFATDMLIDALEEEKTMIETLTQLTESIKSDFKIKCDFWIETDKVVPAVNRLADIKADLVVMGTAGADGLSNYLFGTNTYRVLEKSTKPVLMVPYGVGFTKMNKIVFATDYRKGDILAIKNLKTFADILGCKIEILHVSYQETPVSWEVFQSFKKSVLAEKGLPDNLKFEKIDSPNVADAIDNYMLASGNAMLALSVKHHNIFKKIFTSSVSKKISLMADYPVLAVHE